MNVGKSPRQDSASPSLPVPETSARQWSQVKMSATGERAAQANKPDEKPSTSSLIKQEYFQSVVEEQFGPCKIINFDIKPSAGAGENYMSDMFLVDIDVEKKDGTKDRGNYIIKLMSPYDSQADFKKKMGAFEREVEMYAVILPKFEKLLRDHGVEVKFGPKMWKHLDDPEILILENLKLRKYKNIDRLKGMDMQHAEMALTKLAQYHAASACIFEKEGPYSERFMMEVIKKDSIEEFRVMQSMIWAIICKNIRLWNTCQRHLEKMEKMQDRIGDIYLEAFKKDPEEFNVLLHGDFWANNMMFRENAKGVAEEVLVIDFQVCRHGSPLMDLIYFILSSTESSIKIKEFDYFIRCYHTELVKYLKLLGYPKKLPTLIDLQIAAVKRCFLGIMTSTGVMAAALLDPNKNANMDAFFSDSEAGNQFKKDFYTNPRLIKACEEIFPFLENKGAFDV